METVYNLGSKMIDALSKEKIVAGMCLTTTLGTLSLNNCSQAISFTLTVRLVKSTSWIAATLVAEITTLLVPM